MPKRFITDFPAFADAILSRADADVEHILPPATDAQIKKIEEEVGVPLPVSYKRFLKCARGVWLLGGAIQFGARHPFFHSFAPLSALTPQQQAVVSRKGGGWPPPSDGMLCFAEFFWEADGDQVLWDVSKGLHDGEYPVYYYAHDGRPPSVRKIADSFSEFIGKSLSYFEDED